MNDTENWQFGDTAICRDCRGAIRFDGRAWIHLYTSPRHMGRPETLPGHKIDVPVHANQDKSVTLGTFRTSEATNELVLDVLKSGRLSYGPHSREFERRFAAMHYFRHGVLANSGTSALLVALLALKECQKWAEGSGVLIPATTFVATANAVLQAGLRPVPVDVHPATYNMDVSRFDPPQDCVAMLPVHLMGQLCDMNVLADYGHWRNLWVIEDACESFGVRPELPGIIACYSFYAAHHLVCGVGGMALTNDIVLSNTMRSLVNHGLDTSWLPSGEDYDPSFLNRHFRFARVGYSFRVTELEAALGLAQLPDADAILARRAHNARYLNEHLAHLEEHLQLPVALQPHSWLAYPIVLHHKPKEPLMAHLHAHNIECRSLMPLLSQPAHAHLWRTSDFPVARHLDESGFYVGCHQGLSLTELDRIVEAVEGFYVKHDYR